MGNVTNSSATIIDYDARERATLIEHNARLDPIIGRLTEEHERILAPLVRMTEEALNTARKQREHNAALDAVTPRLANGEIQDTPARREGARSEVAFLREVDAMEAALEALRMGLQMRLIRIVSGM